MLYFCGDWLCIVYAFTKRYALGGHHLHLRTAPACQSMTARRTNFHVILKIQQSGCPIAAIVCVTPIRYLLSIQSAGECQNF